MHVLVTEAGERWMNFPKSLSCMSFSYSYSMASPANLCQHMAAKTVLPWTFLIIQLNQCGYGSL